MIVNKLTIGTRFINTRKLEPQEVGRIIKTAVHNKTKSDRKIEQAATRFSIAERNKHSDEIIPLGGFEFSYNMARQIVEGLH